MHRINGPGATGDGHFTDGSPPSVAATVVEDTWLNTIQNELEAICTEAGIALDDAQDDQVVASIKLIAGRSQGLKNSLINGDMLIAQRRKTAALSVAGGAVSGFVLDRWLQAADTSGTGVATASRQAFTIGQTAVPGDPRYFLRHLQSANATVGNPQVLQKIESIRGFSGIDVTFSVWLKAAASLSVTARVTQNFGTGGSPSSAVLAGSSVFAVTTAWQLFTFTVSLATIASKTLGSANNDCLIIELQMPTGLTFTLDVARAQLELGSSASDFDTRQLGVELALCKRYFEKSWEAETDVGTSTALGAERQVAYSWANAEVEIPVQGSFQVEKRSLPTITWYPVPPATMTAGQVYNGTIAVTVTSTVGISNRKTGTPNVSGGGGSSDPDRYSAHWTAESEI